VITCDGYDVDVEAETGVPEDDFVTLLKWVHARLAEASDGSAMPVLAPYAASDPMLLRGRQRVTALARRVAAEFAVPGWRVEPLRWPTEGNATLAVSGSGDARVEVRFAIGSRGKRSTVGVQFHPATPDGDDDLKGVMQALVDTLRERPSGTAPQGDGAASEPSSLV
jgi:hypothetical protein